MSSRAPFRPTARQINWLLAIGFSCLGYALYFRYLVIEQSSVGLACEAGLKTWLCATRRLVLTLFGNNAFGLVAIAGALIHFARPALPVFALALAAAGFGIVLYNVTLSSFAVAILILSFARPHGATASAREGG